MKIEQIEINHWYEARVPIHGSATEKKRWRPVFAVGVGDNYLSGDAQTVAVIYAAPMSPRGRAIALITPARMRLCVRRMEKNASVDPPAVE